MPYILSDGMSEDMAEWCVVSGWGSLGESNSFATFNLSSDCKRPKGSP